MMNRSRLTTETAGHQSSSHSDDAAAAGRHFTQTHNDKPPSLMTRRLSVAAQIKSIYHNRLMLSSGEMPPLRTT
ncbi:hypothetical protein BaRGS_00001834 [Batillaria attramentaria]|uniref:Uncharacterized protein n=1 Tax=Batillaria attramentaria TaxID=370345 RepID=A0ABD0M666_9CAEN